MIKGTGHEERQESLRKQVIHRTHIVDIPVIIEPNVQVTTHPLCSREVPNLNLDHEVKYPD
jgi:hypothetical protein